MLLPFTDGLIRTTHFDDEMRQLADRHYSRRTVGARQFCYSGRKLVLRNAEGTVLFIWMFPDPALRMDAQTGYNCAMFRREAGHCASDIILEAERWAFEKWGRNRLYTYIDPKKLRVLKRRGIEFCRWPPGRCFLEAGWKFVRTTRDGKHLLAKEQGLDG